MQKVTLCKYDNLVFTDQCPMIVKTALDEEILQMKENYGDSVKITYWPMVSPVGAPYALILQERAEDRRSHLRLEYFKELLSITQDGWHSVLESLVVIGMEIDTPQKPIPEDLYKELTAAVIHKDYLLKRGTSEELTSLCQAVAEVLNTNIEIRFSDPPVIDVFEDDKAEEANHYLETILGWFNPIRYEYSNEARLDLVTSPFTEVFWAIEQLSNHDIVEKTQKIEKFCAEKRELLKNGFEGDTSH